MSYATQAQASQDPDLRLRITACYATQSPTQIPLNWTDANQWELCGSPGWDAAYASALALDPPNQRPGLDDAVISDGMILAAVQALLTKQAA